MLYDDSRLMIVLTELTWRASLLFLEYPVEIAEVIKPAVKSDFTDAFGSIHQHACRIAETKVDDILRNVPARMKFEETAECTRTHTRQRSKLRQAEIIHIILRDIILHL